MRFSPVDDVGRPLLAGLCAAAVVLAGGDGAAATPAVLALVGTVGDQDGVLTLGGWLLAGTVVGGAVGYVLVALTDVPLAMEAGVGLGVALGGGLGVVSNILVTDPDRQSGDETVDVDMSDDEPPTPRPADLFDDHPDPVLYVADEGHGPVVRAANRAYAETFDVPADAVVNASLADAVMSPDRTDEVVEAVEDGRSLDVVVECETIDGDRQFRLRVAGERADWYLVYTPAEW